jgi:hypothetical protein
MLDHRHFQARLEGTPGKWHVIEVSSDLNVWKAVTTNRLLSATWLYKDPDLCTNVSRFYRAFSLP